MPVKQCDETQQSVHIIRYHCLLSRRCPRRLRSSTQQCRLSRRLNYSPECAVALSPILCAVPSPVPSS